MMRAIYSAGLSIYIHRITSAQRTCKVWPSLLVGECNMLLVRYSLDTRARYSTYSPNFKSQKGIAIVLRGKMIGFLPHAHGIVQGLFH